ncbi:MAG TPA: DUF177 domain-containing protein [Vicinamibacterales bacterium]|nr:DUF177 domain-containing protein [Vicinamibacterales bacterium]
MQLDLSQLGRRGRADEHVERTFEPSGLAVDDDYRVTAPVDLVLDLHRERDAIRVRGRVQTRLGLECGRCLEPYEVEVDSPFDLRYLPQPAHAADGEHEVADDDLMTAYYRDETLDIAELLHEQFELALPMKPLCRPDCQGLCPQCGTNLNRETCSCVPRWHDPRLAALEGLLHRDKES